jgi:hypothetical protein
MTYTILSRREEIYYVEQQISETETETVEQTLVFTLVEYNFDGTIVTVEIGHFMPKDEDYIINGIENRAITEQRRLGIIQ